MNLSVFAHTFDADVDQSLMETIATLGFTHMHYNLSSSGLPSITSEIPDKMTRRVNTAMDEYELKCTGLSTTFNLVDPDHERKDYGFAAIPGMSSFATALHAPVLSLCTGTKNPDDKWSWHPDNARPEVWREMLTGMEKLLELTEGTGLLLGVEPEAGNVVCDARLAEQLLRELQSHRIGIILDPANLFEEARHAGQIRDLILEAMDRLHEHIWVVHAKDRALDGTIQPAGKGTVPFAYLFDLLGQANFDGPVVLHGLKAEEVPEASSFLKSILSLG